MRGNKNALEPPPMATSTSDAVEVLRVWAAPGKPQQVVLNPIWKDAGACWGLVLVDVARHAAGAYAQQGHDRATVLARIRELFEAEWAEPTDVPTNLSGS